MFALLHQRRIGRVEFHPCRAGFASQQAQILAQRSHEGLLSQRHSHRAAYRLEGLRHARLALQHFDYMQAEAAVHQTRQHAHLGVTEQLAREVAADPNGIDPLFVDLVERWPGRGRWFG